MPEAKGQGASLPLLVIRKRADFLAAAQRGKKWVATGLILQMKTGSEEKAPMLRYGLTASGKIGSAVIRNRARRRLRTLVMEILPCHAAAGHDYVLIARAATCKRPYADLKRDLITALKKLEAWKDG